jgi:hypothetical protein
MISPTALSDIAGECRKALACPRPDEDRGGVVSNGDFGIARREALHAGAEGPIPAARSRTPTELLHRNVEALFEAELVEVEVEGSILVGYGDAHRPYVRDRSPGLLVHFILLLTDSVRVLEPSSAR